MKKLINAVDDVLAESLAGFGLAHAGIVKINLEPKLVTRVEAPVRGKVALSLDMAGCSVTLTVVDEEMLCLWDAPVHTAALRWAC